MWLMNGARGGKWHFWCRLQNESKLTVLHMTACKSSTCQEPIRSKDAVVVSVGFRTFTGQPIYSVDSHNMDKHKVERFLHPGAMMMASFYAPITFPPAPVLAFRPESCGRWEQLLWSGSVCALPAPQCLLECGRRPAARGAVKKQPACLT